MSDAARPLTTVTAEERVHAAALHLRAGRAAAAADAYAEAVAGGVPEASIAYDYALALSNAGRQDEAEAVLRKVVSRRSRDYRLTILLGVIVKRAGRLEDALALFERAHKLDPKSPAPWINTGNTQMLLQQPRKAVAAFQRAIRSGAKDGEVWRLLAQAQRQAGDGDEAVRSLRRAAALDPRAPEIVSDLVGALLERRALAEADAVVTRARAADPDNGRLKVIQARLLRRLGRDAECRALLDEVLAADPNDLNALLILARLLENVDRESANEVFRRAVAVAPGSMELAAALCESLNRSRYGDEAAHIQEAYECACRIVEQFGAAAAKREAKTLRGIFARCVDGARLEQIGPLAGIVPQWIAQDQVTALHLELGRMRDLDERLAMVAWHRQWGRRVAAQITPLPPRPAPAVIGQRKLRVGFLSSDLRHHPVTYFALPLLERYDREAVEVYCYSFYERDRDAVQAHIEKSVTAFRWWPRQPDEVVARGIADDDLDILFELGGKTDMNKVEVMAYRPARVGASWLGYPHSIGLESIDYLLVDPFIKPADPRLIIERPFEMPETWVVLGRVGFVDFPIDPQPPEDRTGRLTFGTMNNPYKYTPAMFDAWARVLTALPRSRFLFVRPEGGVPAFRANVEAEFAGRGVDPDRVAYVAVRGKHMPHYNDIDVALDTFPHVGGTTTCETLWMGVPTVTLVGPAFYERLSYSNLSNAGLGDLCAFTVEEFVAKAVEIAEDRDRRRRLRTGLRAMIRSRPLGDADRFVRHFYAQCAAVAAG